MEAIVSSKKYNVALIKGKDEIKILCKLIFIHQKANQTSVPLVTENPSGSSFLREEKNTLQGTRAFIL